MPMSRLAMICAATLTLATATPAFAKCAVAGLCVNARGHHSATFGPPKPYRPKPFGAAKHKRTFY
jgi:hypothetical protein